MFKKISIKIGFTETEIKVLLFLLGIFLAGFIYITVIKGSDPEYKEFDYSKEESSLLQSENGDSLDETVNMDGKDSVRNRVLELKDRSYEIPSKKAPIEKSINLNTASKEQLMTIPGIGEKTADNIFVYRGKNGKFKTLEEIMNVKGIGDSKYSKFKKYLFIK